MAGMLPGVEMPRRRAYQGHPSHRSSWHKLPTTTVATTTTTTMDGTAIIARHRLAEKLCYFSPSRFFYEMINYLDHNPVSYEENVTTSKEGRASLSRKLSP
ncbi:hypothetical protein U1Q18_041560 [Sarracenia purpurea var. burkii]